MVVEGVDVSKFQGGEYPSAEFYIVRLGSYLTSDPRAADHVAYAKAHRIPVGGYWALYEGQGELQANTCYGIMVRLGLDRVAADAEQFKGASTLTLHTVQAFVARMRQLNADCGLYSGYYWIKAHGGADAGADWTWLADYTGFALPSGWTKAKTVLWQYTSSAGTLDKDRYLGDIDVAEFFQGGADVGELDDFIQGMTDAEDGKDLNDGWTEYRKKGWRRQHKALTSPAPGGAAQPHDHNVPSVTTSTSP